MTTLTDHAPPVPRTPASYLPAKWRGTLPYDPALGCIGVAFDMPDGTTLRIRLPLDDATALGETLAENLAKDAARHMPARQSANELLTEFVERHEQNRRTHS